MAGTFGGLQKGKTVEAEGFVHVWAIILFKYTCCFCLSTVWRVIMILTKCHHAGKMEEIENERLACFMCTAAAWMLGGHGRL